MKIDYEIFLYLLNNNNKISDSYVSFGKLMNGVKSIPPTDAKLNTLLARLDVLERFGLVEILKNSSNFPIAIRITTKGQLVAA